MLMMVIAVLRLCGVPKAGHFHESYLGLLGTFTVVRGPGHVRYRYWRTCVVAVPRYGVKPYNAHGSSVPRSALSERMF